MSTARALRSPKSGQSTDREGSFASVAAPRVRQLAFDAAAALARVTAPADPEALHEFRVAIRRLSAALNVARSLNTEGFQTERDCLRWAFRSVGKPRDLDVQLAILETYRASMSDSDREQFEPVMSWFERRRGPVRSAMHRKLRSRRLGQLLEELTRFTPQIDPSTGPSDAVEISKVVLRRGARLDRSIRSLKRKSDTGRFHRTRIRAKRVRYTIEAYSDVLPKRTAKFLSSLKTVQSMLGDEHDAVVLADTLDRIATQYGFHWSPETHELVREVQQDLQKRAAQIRRKFLRRRVKANRDGWRRTRKALRRAAARGDVRTLETTADSSRSGGDSKLITLAG